MGQGTPADIKGAIAVDAFDAIVKQAAVVDASRAKFLRDRAKLDKLVAESVSSAPSTRTWYAKAGTLSLDQVCQAAGWSLSQLDNGIVRYRKARRAAATTAKTTRAPRKTKKQRVQESLAKAGR